MSFLERRESEIVNRWPEKGDDMTQVLIDAALRSRLQDLKRPLELCDESGKVVARLIPVPDPSQYEPIEPHISAEELQRRRQEPDFSTAEVLAYLEKLLCSRFAGNVRP